MESKHQPSAPSRANVPERQRPLSLHKGGYRVPVIQRNFEAVGSLGTFLGRLDRSSYFSR